MPSGPIDLENLPALVVCFDPDLAEAAGYSGAGGAHLVADPGVTLSGLEGARRLDWTQLQALPKGSLAVQRLVVHTLRGVNPSGLRAALRQCAPDVECVLVDSHGSWFTSNGRGALWLSLGRTARRGLGKTSVGRLSAKHLRYTIDPPWPNLQATLQAPERILAYAQAHPPRAPAATPRIAHYVSALGAGGAERQLALLAKRSRARGHEVQVWTTHPLEGDAGHYLPDLQRAGVPVKALEMPPRTLTLDEDQIPGLKLIQNHLSSLPLFALILELQRARPNVLHCWLDEPNVIGGLAGLLAGVPRIVLSTRNVSPVHFPRLFYPWYRDTYRALSQAPQVTLIGNSAAGAADYAEWLDLPVERFQVVYNGFEPPPLEDERAATRAELGVDDATFLVLGVFRLAEEKRPLDFVRLVARLKAAVPRLRVVHLGVGELVEETHREAARLQLGDVLEFRGRVPDPWRYLQAADASVLTSDNEGCPNVSLESQALGTPIVATRVGGTPETLRDGETGFLCELGDLEGLAARLAELARDPELRARMGAAGRELIAERFGVEGMVDSSLALYAADRIDSEA